MAEIIDKYELIIAASRKLIEEMGFSALTMDKVAAEAGIAKGTVYLYFKNKNELMDKVLSAGFERMFEKIKTRVKLEKPGIGQLKALIEENISHIYENGNFFKTIFLDEVNIVFLKKNSKESFNLRRKRYADFIGQIIKAGADCGEFRMDIDSLKGGYMLLALIKTGALYNFINGTSQFTAEMIKSDTDEILNLFLRGIINGR